MKSNTRTENMHKNKVYYSSELARAISFFTLEEEKLLHIVLGKLNPRTKNPLVISFPKKEIFEKLNLIEKDECDRYAKIFKGLAKKTYAWLTNINGIVCAAALINRSEWEKKVQDVKIRLNPNFMHHLEQFTSYHVLIQEKSILSLNTKNAVTLYQYLISWKNMSVAANEVYAGIRKLKKMFDLRDTAYAHKGRFNNFLFEKYTLKKYIKDINENTELNVWYAEIELKNGAGSYIFYVEFKSWDQLNKKFFIKDLEKNKKIYSLSETKTYDTNTFVAELQDEMVLSEDLEKNKKIYSSSETKTYDTNPFVAELQDKMVLSEDLILGERKLVDKSSHAKVYDSKIRVLYHLTKRAMKVFLYLIEIMDFDNEVVLDYSRDFKKTGFKSEKSYLKGIGELLTKEIIAKHAFRHVYWINPTIARKGGGSATYEFIED